MVQENDFEENFSSHDFIWNWRQLEDSPLHNNNALLFS